MCDAQVFKVVLQPDTIGNRLAEVQKAVQDLDKFGKTVELVGLAPFQGTQDALQEINDISEGILSDFLKATLETNLPKAGKKKTITLGVSEANLAGSIKAAFPNLSCETSVTSEVVADLLRGLRQHSGKLIKKLQPGDIDRSILGLGHAYSRAKVKFSVQKQDNHIIQAIATLDQIDKDVCTAIVYSSIPKLTPFSSINSACACAKTMDGTSQSSPRSCPTMISMPRSY
jgi:nucleolar protein 56